MRKHKPIETTLGDLIVALTEELSPFAQNHHRRNVLVLYVLRDLFARHWVRLNPTATVPKVARLNKG